jgi:hypothetical protein
VKYAQTPRFVTVQQPRVDQHLQMVGHRRLGQPQRFGEVTDARLPAVVGGDQRQQPQPGRVGDGLQRPGEIRCRFRVQRLTDQRGAARHVHQRQARGGHDISMPGALTTVDMWFTMIETLICVYVKGLA